MSFGFYIDILPTRKKLVYCSGNDDYRWVFLRVVDMSVGLDTDDSEIREFITKTLHKNNRITKSVMIRRYTFYEFNPYLFY